jgi:hypothetical protein
LRQYLAGSEAKQKMAWFSPVPPKVVIFSVRSGVDLPPQSLAESASGFLIQFDAIDPVTEEANSATECSYALKIRILKEHQSFHSIIV